MIMHRVEVLCGGDIEPSAHLGLGFCCRRLFGACRLGARASSQPLISWGARRLLRGRKRAQRLDHDVIEATVPLATTTARVVLKTTTPHHQRMRYNAPSCNGWTGEGGTVGRGAASPKSLLPSGNHLSAGEQAAVQQRRESQSHGKVTHTTWVAAYLTCSLAAQNDP